MSQKINRNITSSTGRTSLRLEIEFWNALEIIRVNKNIRSSELIQEIETMYPTYGRTEAVRVYVLQYFMDKFDMNAEV